MRKAAIRVLKTALTAIVVIPLGVGIGKAIEYGIVDLLGDRLGFDGAALIGIAIFVILAFTASRSLTRWKARKILPGRSLVRPQSDPSSP